MDSSVQPVPTLSLQDRSILRTHWTIPLPAESKSGMKHLLLVAEITAAVQGWITEESRRAQNNMQMFTCIMASLTKEGRIKILAEQDKYHVGEGTNRRACAALLFKLLMQKAIIDTRATASLLRENLSSLDTYMSTVKSNIEQFNKYVKVNWEGLKARGESCDDLMINR